MHESSAGTSLALHPADAPVPTTRFVAVRFGNVLGSSGSVVPIFRKQIAAGGPVTVTHPEMRRYFMTIPEAAQLVMQAGAIGKGGEVFVLDMGQPVRILDLAVQMIRDAGLTPGEDIEIRFTGIRPGEKLFEELSHTDEQTQPTSHHKIRIWKLPSVDPRRLEASIERLSSVVDAGRSAVLAALCACVPEFRPDVQVDAVAEQQAIAPRDQASELRRLAARAA
jgi:FlaA1/EpsC-like NDP-sugar epimerase